MCEQEAREREQVRHAASIGGKHARAGGVEEAQVGHLVRVGLRLRVRGRVRVKG